MAQLLVVVIYWQECKKSWRYAPICCKSSYSGSPPLLLRLVGTSPTIFLHSVGIFCMLAPDMECAFEGHLWLVLVAQVYHDARLGRDCRLSLLTPTPIAVGTTPKRLSHTYANHIYAFGPFW